MVVTPMWKLRLLLFLGTAKAWLRNLFLTRAQKLEHYHQAVTEEAFEIWMNCGEEFAAAIEGRIAGAKARGEHNSVRFWQDVFASAHEFDHHPENRRKRAAMTVEG
jgi:hypothetical protein